MTIAMIFLVIALALFLADAIGLASRVNLTALGLASLTAGDVGGSDLK